MLYNNRIDLSIEIDPAKTNNNKKCIVCDNCFLIMVEFQDSICNYCQDFTMLCLNPSNIAIIIVVSITLANM